VEAPSTGNPTNEKQEVVTVIEEARLRGNSRFDFSALQCIQKLQEKTDETLLALTMNINIIQDLSRYYKNLQCSPHWPENFVKETEDNVDRFHVVVSEATTDMEMQRSRLENLRRVLADRKTLVSGSPSMLHVQHEADTIKLHAILDYDNVQMNKLSTEKQQVSAMKMEIMTHEMREIALKTENETVSMRIVTWVTLFFLPGTFVSVSFGLFVGYET